MAPAPSKLQTKRQYGKDSGGGRSRRWCFTYNNYPLCVHHVEWIKQRHSITRCVVGYEKGANGTRHLQGYLESKNPVRLSTLKDIYDSAHWEFAFGSAKENYDYCTKDGTYQVHGEWDNILKRKGEQKKNGISTENILAGILSGQGQSVKNSGSYLSRKRAIDERVMELRELQVRNANFSRLCDSKLYKWQLDIIQSLKNQGDRRILWVVDVEGGHGKSFLAKLLMYCYGYDLFDGVTKASDISFLISPVPIGFVFDVTRDDSSKFSYSTLEMVKNGFVMSGKYAGIKRMFSPVPVIVFANFHPDKSKLSADRWDIQDIQNAAMDTPKETLPTPLHPPEKVPELIQEEKDPKKNRAEGSIHEGPDNNTSDNNSRDEISSSQS